jgi:hypothetical protein
VLAIAVDVLDAGERGWIVGGGAVTHHGSAVAR